MLRSEIIAATTALIYELLGRDHAAEGTGRGMLFEVAATSGQTETGLLAEARRVEHAAHARQH